jgi:hypothetical protein
MILVLADRDQAAIARYLKIDLDAVKAWEALFFDVRPALEATGFIYHHVILPLRAKGDWVLARRLEVAYVAPLAAFVVARFVGDEPIEELLPVSECERLIERRIQIDARMQAALAVSCETEAGALRFIMMYLKDSIQRRRIEIQGVRLAEKCREAERKHTIRKLREQRRLRRDEQRHAERQHRIVLKAAFKTDQAARRFRLRELQLKNARARCEQQQSEKAAAAKRQAEREYHKSIERLAKAAEAIVPASEIERRRRNHSRRAGIRPAPRFQALASQQARNHKRQKACRLRATSHTNPGDPQ